MPNNTTQQTSRTPRLSLTGRVRFSSQFALQSALRLSEEHVKLRGRSVKPVLKGGAQSRLQSPSVGSFMGKLMQKLAHPDIVIMEDELLRLRTTAPYKLVITNQDTTSNRGKHLEKD
ncbi:hypothetical protein Q8A73_009653 [Channa argus]|nr:hypothetical protein Q8A73_009653 [Channa argus]